MELQGAGRRAVERDPLEIGLLERQIAVSERAARAPRLRATPPVDEGVRCLCSVDVHADLMPHVQHVPKEALIRVSAHEAPGILLERRSLLGRSCP